MLIKQLRFAELLWLWNYMRQHPLMTFITIVGSVIEIILFSLPAIYTAVIVDLFLRSAPFSEIIFWLALMLFTALLDSLVFFIVASINEILAHRMTTDMTADLFETLQNRPLYYHDTLQIGDVMARATGDTRIINIGLSPAFRVFWQVIVAIITFLIVLFSINYQLTLVFLFFAPIYIITLFKYGATLAPLSQKVQEAFGDLSILTAESIKVVRELKSNNAERTFFDKFTHYANLHAFNVSFLERRAAYYLPGFLMALILAVTTFIGIIFMMQGSLTLSELVAFTGLITILLSISTRLKTITESIAKTIAASKRIMEMLYDDITPELTGTKDFTGEETTITFHDVSFSYNNHRERAIDNVSVTINHGETVAIIGGPGSGKTTFNKLILKLYHPTSGKITIGGKNIETYSQDSIRKKISSIEQDIFLFYDTVAANISFGNPSATKEEIIEAAKLAEAHDFISELEQGYDTEIGERGVRLSGGQKQRIAIARALVMNPAILIMDDASSALDAETEYKIQQAIRTILKTRTSIITTHRLSIISEVDRVLLFDKGKIIADGPHDVLLRSSPEYRKLFEVYFEIPQLTHIIDKGDFHEFS